MWHDPLCPQTLIVSPYTEITPIVESPQGWWRLLVHNRFWQRVRELLLGPGLPRWEIDPHFDLKYHLPQVSLPAPGGQMELQRLVGDLMSRPLDRAHPLWRFFCVENY